MTIRRSGEPAALAVTGEVTHAIRLDLAEVHELAARTGAPVEDDSRWLPVQIVLGEAQVADTARYVTFVSADGLYRACVPLDEAVRKGKLLIGADPSGLPTTDGGPIRLIVPDGETLCWNVKNVAGLHVTVAKEADSVPENPPH